MMLQYHQNISVLIDFCKFALDYLQNGPNPKRYNTAANKLEVDFEVIENAIQGLVNLLLESCKNELSEEDFRDSVLSVGFNQDQADILVQFYQSKNTEITPALSKFSNTTKHYNDLDWRFEIEVASRSQIKHIKPVVTMNLLLQDKADGLFLTKKCQGKEEWITLESDIPNLVHLTKTLEQALNTLRTPQYKRIQRSLQITQ